MIVYRILLLEKTEIQFLAFHSASFLSPGWLRRSQGSFSLLLTIIEVEWHLSLACSAHARARCKKKKKKKVAAKNNTILAFVPRFYEFYIGESVRSQPWARFLAHEINSSTPWRLRLEILHNRNPFQKSS